MTSTGFLGDLQVELDCGRRIGVDPSAVVPAGGSDPGSTAGCVVILALSGATAAALAAGAGGWLV